MLRSSSQNLLLIHHILNDLGLLHVTSIKNLDCVNLVCFFIVAGIHLAKVARSEFLDNVKIADDHFLLMIVLSCRLPDRLGHLRFGFRLFYFKVNVHSTNKTFTSSHDILRHSELLMSHQLAQLNYRIRLI